MELKEVASISGKPGLFRILKPTYNGVVVETLDGQKKKMAVSASSKVSILKEISIYTTQQEGSVALQEVLCRIFEKYAHNLPVTSKADTADLMKFISEIVPDYDESKVYPSDIKKLVTWYGIISANAVELLARVEETADLKEVEKAEPKEVKAKAEPKEAEAKAEPKEAEAKAEPKEAEAEPKEVKAEAKAKAEPKEVKAKAEPKEAKAKAEPKEVKAKAEPKEVKAKAEPKEVKVKTEPKEKKTTEKKAK